MSFSITNFESKVCNTYTSNISYKDDDTIIFGDTISTFIQCNPITEAHYNKFEDYYYGD